MEGEDCSPTEAALERTIIPATLLMLAVKTDAKVNTSHAGTPARTDSVGTNRVPLERPKLPGTSGRRVSHNVNSPTMAAIRAAGKKASKSASAPACSSSG